MSRERKDERIGKMRAGRGVDMGLDLGCPMLMGSDGEEKGISGLVNA